jgi:hypothetical protein
MAKKRILAVKGRRTTALKVISILLAGVGLFYYASVRKEALIREGTNVLQNLLSRETDYDVKIGKISGKITGLVRFDDVRLEKPGIPQELRTVFQAEQVEFHYSLFDFLAKQQFSKISIKLKRPVVTWYPQIRLRNAPLPWLETFRYLLLTQRHRLNVNIQDMTVVYGTDRQTFTGINGQYSNDTFVASVPVRHWTILENDLSTELNIKGKLAFGGAGAEDRLEGQIFTQGSVINWQPLPWESKFDFTLSKNEFSILSSDILGGLEVTGDIDISNEPKFDVQLQAKDYPIKNFEPFFGRGTIGSYDGFLTLESLHMGLHARLVGGKAGKRHYQAMNLHAEGVYPTLTLFDSQMMMEDGVVMKFGRQTVEFRELFSSRTYKELIKAVDQDSVAMGDWEFSRPLGEGKKPEFLVERSLGKYARVKFRKYNEPEEKKLDLNRNDEDPRKEMEVGLEYKLRAEDSVQYKVREDEQFVGVERKMNF